MKCIEGEYSYKGASVRITVYTSSNAVCNEVREAGSRGIDGVLSFIRRHGGCYIESEEPLTITAGDNTTTVVVSPINFIARMFWGKAIDKVREVCRG